MTALGRGHAQPGLRVTEPAITESVGQGVREDTAVVGSDQAARYAARYAPDSAGSEYLGTAARIEFEQTSRRESGAKSESYDAARRSARDQVEVTRDRCSVKISPLESLQNGGGEDAANAPAVDGKDAEGPVLGPRQGLPPPAKSAR